VGSAPDNAFLIEEVIDHFDAVTHLNLRLFRHRENGANQLARLNVVERRNAMGSTLFQLLSKTCHSYPLIPRLLDRQSLRQKSLLM